MRHSLKRLKFWLALAAVLCGVMSFTPLDAADFIFFWKASADPAVSAYGVYQSTGGSVYVKIDEVGVQDLDDPASPFYRLTDLAEGTTYRFAATSISGSGLESDFFSNTCITVNGQVVECGDNEESGASIFISCFIGSAGEGFFKKTVGSDPQ